MEERIIDINNKPDVQDKINFLANEVCEYFDIDLLQLKGKNWSRNIAVSEAKYVFINIATKEMKLYYRNLLPFFTVRQACTLYYYTTINKYREETKLAYKSILKNYKVWQER